MSLPGYAAGIERVGWVFGNRECWRTLVNVRVRVSENRGCRAGRGGLGRVRLSRRLAAIDGVEKDVVTVTGLCVADVGREISGVRCGHIIAGFDAEECSRRHQNSRKQAHQQNFTLLPTYTRA